MSHEQTGTQIHHVRRTQKAKAPQRNLRKLDHEQGLDFSSIHQRGKGIWPPYREGGEHQEKEESATEKRKEDNKRSRTSTLQEPGEGFLGLCEMGGFRSLFFFLLDSREQPDFRTDPSYPDLPVGLQPVVEIFLAAPRRRIDFLARGVGWAPSIPAFPARQGDVAQLPNQAANALAQ